jgi:hypothetical protein
MAIVKFSDIIGDASGKIGSAQIARNQHATFLSPLRKARNPASISQTIARSRYPKITAAWKALSQAQRDDYNTFAADTDNYVVNRLAESRPLSGWNVFQRQTHNKLLLSLATPTAPPATPFPEAPTIIVAYCVNYAPSSWSIGYTHDDAEFTDYYSIVALSYTPTNAFLDTQTHWKTVQANAPYTAGGKSIAGNVLLKFGTPIVGNGFHLRICRLAADGGRSPNYHVYCAVTKTF